MALKLDTDFIDSHEDLGINAPPKDRVKFCRVTTCSIVPPTAYNDTLVDYTNSSVRGILQYYFGPKAIVSDSNLSVQNWTFEYETVQTNFSLGYDLKWESV